jgi:hypothetical protein
MSVNPQIRSRDDVERDRPADAFVTGSGSKFKVHSPATVNGRSRVFIFANHTLDVAIVTLADSVVGSGGVCTDVPSLGVAEFGLKSKAAGAHEYSVVMRTTDGRLVTAHGSSDPVIIIDPPCP